MAKATSGKKKARVWYSKGDPSGSKQAKGLNYRERSVQCPTEGKRKRRGF